MTDDTIAPEPAPFDPMVFIRALADFPCPASMAAAAVALFALEEHGPLPMLLAELYSAVLDSFDHTDVRPN